MARGSSKANSELDRFGRYNPMAKRGDAMEDAFGFNYNQRGFFDRYVKQMAGGPYTLERIVNTFRGNLDGPENRQLALAALKAMEQSTVSSAFKQANELRSLLRIPRIAAPGSRAESEAGRTPNQIAAGVVNSNTMRMDELRRMMENTARTSPNWEAGKAEYLELRAEAKKARDSMTDKEDRKLANFSLRTSVPPIDSTGQRMFD
jgi:hypothetical protein